MSNQKMQPTSNITEHGDTHDQLESWKIDGLNTSKDAKNVDRDGKLYVSLTHSGTTRTVTIWKDSGKADGDKVASGSCVGDGTITLAAENSSGLSGSVEVTADTDLTDDTDIELWCFYAIDEDLALFEKTLSDWLPSMS